MHIDSKQFEDATEIVNDVLLNAGIWNFVMIILRNNPELPEGVYFLTASDLSKVAKALSKIVKRENIGYDDEAFPPQVMVQVELKDIFPKCYTPEYLARIANRAERDKRQAKHFPRPVPLTDRQAAEAYVASTVASIKNVLGDV